MTKVDLRNNFITASFMISPEPSDWHSYSELLEDEIIKYEERSTSLHLKSIKDKTEAYKELSSLRSQLLEREKEIIELDTEIKELRKEIERLGKQSFY